MADFATSGDLTKGWRPLLQDETRRAPELIAKASRHLRAEFRSRDLDALIAAGTIDAGLVRDVICDMVRRVLVVPVDERPADQVTQASGPFSVGVKYTNPAGDMYLTKAERRKLGLTRPRAGGVDTWDTSTATGAAIESF
jgi:hypothetical protein